MTTLQIDGRAVKAELGATVLEAARGVGIEIPTLCHVQGLSPYGACRLCTVEITEQGRKSLQASCCYPVSEGLQVQTETPAILKGRKLLLQLYLARCPNAPSVQELAAKWGVVDTPFPPKDEDCVLCGLCVRTCASLPQAEAIAFTNRGTTRKVGTPFGMPSSRCLACGACTFVCPTGAIQMEAETVVQLRKLPGVERKCRYMLMGLVPSKLCPNNYDCAQCAFDQTMELRFGTHPAFALAAARDKDHANPDR
jgi:predicted molibdopterin-dependent oxidoreductase YjgC